MEWKLFDTEPPERVEDLAERSWMNLRGQPGFFQRSRMTAELVKLCLVVGRHTTVSELGCGDGSLLTMMPQNVTSWGYEIGTGDVGYARMHGLDVRKADIVAQAADLDYGDVIILSEVLEHIADPGDLLRKLPNAVLVATSPSAETLEWHNEIHAWAWDPAGYRELFERADYNVLYHSECDGGPNSFNGVSGMQRFQAIVAAR